MLSGDQRVRQLVVSGTTGRQSLDHAGGDGLVRRNEHCPQSAGGRSAQCRELRCVAPHPVMGRPPVLNQRLTRTVTGRVDCLSRLSGMPRRCSPRPDATTTWTSGSVLNRPPAPSMPPPPAAGQSSGCLDRITPPGSCSSRILRSGDPAGQNPGQGDRRRVGARGGPGGRHSHHSFMSGLNGAGGEGGGATTADRLVPPCCLALAALEQE